MLNVIGSVVPTSLSSYVWLVILVIVAVLVAKGSEENS